MKFRSRKSVIDTVTGGPLGPAVEADAASDGADPAEGWAGFNTTSMAVFITPPRTVNSRSSVMNPACSHRTRYNPSLSFGMTVVPAAPVVYAPAAAPERIRCTPDNGARFWSRTEICTDDVRAGAD